MFRRFHLLFLLALAVAFLMPSKASGLEKWLYLHPNLDDTGQLRSTYDLLRRAAAAGYTKVAFADPKLDSLHRQDSRYFSNLRKVRILADRLGLEMIPGMFMIGYSGDILSHNPNLAEGPPVKDQEFIVMNGKAVLASRGKQLLKGSDFSDLSLWSWKDDLVSADNGTAKLSGLEDGIQARIVQTFPTRPFTQYRLKVRVKTENFSLQPACLIQGKDGKDLNYTQLEPMQATQGWVENTVLFNSYDNDQMSVYLGAWGKSGGSAWWDDCTIEEVSFVNLVRRPGTPLSVSLKDGTILKEGVDFAELKDSKLGNHRFPGDYGFRHDGPTLTILDRKKVPDGTLIRASYWHAQIAERSQVTVDLCAPELQPILKDIFDRNFEIWGKGDYFLKHDEIRAGGWSQDFDKTGKTCGQVLAESLQSCAKMVRQYSPDAKLYAWNCMFDPNHNAIDDYYFNRDSLQGSWEGLDPGIRVFNWNYYRREKSLKFFAEKGQPVVIAGFYDGPLSHVEDWQKTVESMPELKVEGFMYATFQNDYSQLEAVSKLLDQWK